MSSATTPAVPLRWVREPQARQYLGGVSVRTWKRWEAKGIVKGFVVDKTKLFDLVALDRQVMGSKARPAGLGGQARKQQVPRANVVDAA